MHPRQDFESAGDRHHEVEQHDIEIDLADRLDRLAAVGCKFDGMTRPAQNRADQRTNFSVVLGDQHACHGSDPFSRGNCIMNMHR